MGMLGGRANMLGNDFTGRGSPASDSLTKKKGCLTQGYLSGPQAATSPSLLHDLIDVGVDPSVSP